MHTVWFAEESDKMQRILTQLMYKCPGGRSPAPSTSTGTAESSQDDDGARPVAPLGPQSVVEALRESPAQLGFGFSAGGLLCAILAFPEPGTKSNSLETRGTCLHHESSSSS